MLWTIIHFTFRAILDQNFPRKIYLSQCSDSPLQIETQICIFRCAQLEQSIDDVIRSRDDVTNQLKGAEDRNEELKHQLDTLQETVASNSSGKLVGLVFWSEKHHDNNIRTNRCQ